MEIVQTNYTSGLGMKIIHKNKEYSVTLSEYGDGYTGICDEMKVTARAPNLRELADKIIEKIESQNETQ